jgi:hypothetical protein
MSLLLNSSPKTDPGVEVKTYGPIGDMADEVHIRTNKGNIVIGLQDFLSAVEYVLTNTNFEPDDPRINFSNWVSNLEIGPGYDNVGKRFIVHSAGPHRCGGD